MNEGDAMIFWTCLTCWTGGRDPDPAVIMAARLAHVRENPACGMIVIEWPDWSPAVAHALIGDTTATIEPTNRPGESPSDVRGARRSG